MRVRTLPAPHLARAALAAAWACAAWFGSRECVAASCPVELRGAPSEHWVRAGRALEALTTDLSDCARVEIELEQGTDGARLIFQTRGGRRAERRLTHPDELMPSVLALGVRGTSESSAPPREQGPVAPARAAQAVSPPDLPRLEPAAASGNAHVHFALLGGLRAGTGHLVSPIIGGAAGIALDRWELGINLALELEYSSLRRSQRLEPSSAVSVGITAGRREPIADLELLFGARSMVAAVNDDSQEASGDPVRAELRLGAYLGSVWPRQSSPRLRADLALDVVPHASRAAMGPSVTPWLAVGALVGVELGGP